MCPPSGLIPSIARNLSSSSFILTFLSTWKTPKYPKHVGASAPASEFRVTLEAAKGACTRSELVQQSQRDDEEIQ